MSNEDITLVVLNIPSKRELYLWYEGGKMRVGQVFVELTNFCNFNCAFCANELMTRERGFMDLGLARKVLDEVSERISGRVVFHLMGEPLLHKDWYEIFSYANNRGLRTTFNTNGSQLDDKTAERLFSLGIEKIVLSLQTPDPETFRLRKAGGLTFEEYTRRIEGAIRKKFEVGSNAVLDLDLLNTSNRGLIDLREDIRVLEDDEAARRAVARWATFGSGLMEELGMPFTPPTEREIEALSLRAGFNLEILPGVFISSRKATNWANRITNSERVIPGLVGGCDALKGQVGILWNGDLVLCCVDYDGRTAMGNVGDSSITEILAGDEARRIRRNFERGLLTHPYCKLCRGGTTRKTWLIRQFGSLAVYNLGYKYLDA